MSASRRISFTSIRIRTPCIAATSAIRSRTAESNAHIATAIAELAKLPQVDPSKIAVKGVCQTGRHPLVYAAEHPIAAALIWYGAAGDKEWKVNEQFPKPFDDVIARVDCPVLGIFGEADHVISLADVRRLRDSFDRHDKTYTIKVYPGAPHGWLNDTMPGRYRRDAAEAAWAFQLAFLKACVRSGLRQIAPRADLRIRTRRRLRFHEKQTPGVTALHPE